MKKYKYLLFDNDGTLMDFDKSQESAFEKTYNALNFSQDYSEHILNLYKKANISWWKKLERGECTKAELQSGRFTDFLQSSTLEANPVEMNKVYMDFLCRENQLIEGAVDVLRTLHEKYKIIIITNGVGKTQHSRIESSEIYPFIDGLYISEEVGAPKPNWEFFDNVLKKESIGQKNQCLIIGDSLSSDILGANNSSIDCCWYNPKNEKNPGLKIDFEISTLRELLVLL